MSKHYFKSSELPHIFAHQSATHGKCPTAETFDGGIYFSYSTAIGQLTKGKNGQAGVILNLTSYSITTSGHLSGLRGAVSHFEHKFSVEGISQGTRRLPEGPELRDNYLKRAEEALEPRQKWLEGKYVTIKEKAATKAARVQHAHHLLSEAIRACEFYGLPTKAIEKQRQKLDTDGAEKVMADRQAQKERIARKLAKEQRQRNEENARNYLAATDEEAIHAYRYLDHGFQSLDHNPELKAQVQAKYDRLEAEKRERWIAGDRSVRPGRDWPDLLRVIQGDYGSGVETTQGVRIPIDDAQRAYRFARAVRSKGWRKNGEECKVGHYELEAVNELGVIAGCHRITWEEIERFAKSQGWDQPEPVNA